MTVEPLTGRPSQQQASTLNWITANSCSTECLHCLVNLCYKGQWVGLLLVDTQVLIIMILGSSSLKTHFFEDI